MDRKTFDRLFAKLQNEGKIKCVKISVPGIRNGGLNKVIDLLTLPEVELSSEILQQIYARNRELERMLRPGLKSKDPLKYGGENLPKLEMVQHLNVSKPISNDEEIASQEIDLREESKSQALEIQGIDDPFSWLRKNGFILPRMVRVRVFHSFLVPFVQKVNHSCQTG